MNLHAFWALHADALGVAMAAVALLVLGWWRLDRRHRQERRVLRLTYQGRRIDDRVELHDRYGALVRHLAQRKPTYDEHIAQAATVAGHADALATIRTRLMEDIGDLTMDTPRSPYAPLPYDGMGVAR
jgi:hypothetical protein